MVASPTEAASPSDARLAASLPPAALVLGRVNGENFPVASLVLGRRLRADLLAVYGWARLVDQLGDDFPGDRLAALDLVEAQLEAALDARATPDIHPLVADAARCVRRVGLAPGPMLDLVQANRQDQTVKHYETFEELLAYCTLSANPVGRLVLAIFGESTPQRVRWSDQICTALQLAEHLQDVAEDAVVGRVYLPAEDRERFGVSVGDLDPPPTSYVDRRRRDAPGGATPELRALIAFEAARARELLREGTPLVRSLGGRLAIAVAGFIAGGHSALDAIAARDFDPFADTARPSRLRRATRLATTLLRPDPPTGIGAAAANSTSAPL